VYVRLQIGKIFDCLIFLQKLGKEIISQLKDQKKKGKTGPLKLQKVLKPKKGGDSDSEDERKFSNITAQLAWERDIDLSKGQAFTKDPGLIENRNSRQAGIGHNTMGNGLQDKKSPILEEQPRVPNGNANSARMIKRVIKKPNGNPKSSPKTQKQFPINRVTPLPFYKQEEDPLEFALDDSEADDLPAVFHGQTSRSSNSDLYSSVLSTRKSIDKGNDSFIVTSDDRFVSEIKQGSVKLVDNSDTKMNNETRQVRANSADSKNIDQWVNEIMEESRETSPSKSNSSGSPSRHSAKSKKRKKEKKEKKERSEKEKMERDLERSESKERKSKKHRIKTPTSEEFLISDSDVDESVL